MVSPKLIDDGVKFPGIALYSDVDEAIAAAAKFLGPGPQRVGVFPAGGVSYPVMAP